MKLFQKGILLIATPIVAQFIFVLVLLAAYRVTEEMAWKEMRARTQTSELMSISIDCYRAIGLLSAYGLSEDKNLLPVFDRLIEILHKKCQNLELLEREMPDLKSVVPTRDAIDKAISDLEGGKKYLLLKRGKVFSSVMLLTEVQRDVDSALSNLAVLVDERSKRAVSDASLIEKRRWIFLSAVILGFTANMLMSAGLLALYAKQFAGRFTVLMDNTQKLAAGEELNPRISGTDELAELDRVFHEMNQSLKEAEDRKNQLMAMVSHDLRSPLTAITITLEVIRNTMGDLPEVFVTRIDNTRRIVKRLINLVSDVLDLDKLRVGKLKLTLEAVPAAEVVTECLKELEPIAAKSSVSLVSSVDSQVVVADRERLCQIFINLTGNAIKFSPPGGTVEIACREKKSDDKNFFQFLVSDQGPGVPEDYRETIFLPFEQVPDNKRKKAGSTGLGLPICKLLVELHGGKIGVENRDKGSSFWFTLSQAEIEEI